MSPRRVLLVAVLGVVIASACLEAASAQTPLPVTQAVYYRYPGGMAATPYPVVDWRYGYGAYAPWRYRPSYASAYGWTSNYFGLYGGGYSYPYMSGFGPYYGSYFHLPSYGFGYSYPYYGAQGLNFSYPYNVGGFYYPPAYGGYSPWAGFYGSNYGLGFTYGASPWLFGCAGNYGPGYYW